ncbi:ACT domain-containing protein acr4 [Orobanche minor]
MDSANKHGIILEVVQILTDLNPVVTKAYICSDGGWFMDDPDCKLSFAEDLAKTRKRKP